MSELSSLEKAKLAANAALDKVASDVVAIDVSDVVSFADLFLIASGRSDRQVRSIASFRSFPRTMSFATIES